MFEYYKGYEIDGSDTAYDLFTPSLEKLRELIKYYLSLKIIDKDEPIKITDATKKTSKHLKPKDITELIGKEYNRDNLDEIFRDMLKFDVYMIELEYTYVGIESLYPEIKREIIDIFGNEKIKYKNPDLTFFYGMEKAKDGICIYIKEPKAEVMLEYRNILMPKDLIDVCVKDKYFDVSFYVSTVQGRTLPLHSAYTLEKISKRFPEYKINALEDFNRISSHKMISEYYIYESIEIPFEKIKSLMGNEKIKFITTYSQREKAYIENGNVYLNQIFYYSKPFEDEIHRINLENELPLHFKLYTIAKKIIPNFNGYASFEEYIKICEKIFEIGYLKKEEINKFTTMFFELYENVNSEEYTNGKIRLKIKDGKVSFEFLFMPKSNEQIEKIYRMVERKINE